MRNIFYILLILLIPTLNAASSGSVFSARVTIENKSFNITQHNEYHIRVLLGETEEHMFIPAMGKDTTKTFNIERGEFFKAVFGTKGDYPFVLGGFGSLSTTETDASFNIHITLEASDDPLTTCPIKLGSSVFTITPQTTEN